MTRFVLAIFALFSGLGLIFSFLTMATSRADSLTQAVLGIASGIGALIFIISIGLFSLLGLMTRQNERIETAVKDIALSNSDAAKAVRAVQALMEAPAEAQRAAQAAKEEEEKKARMAAYRAELQANGQPLSRLEVEAAMLEKAGEAGRGKA